MRTDNFEFSEATLPDEDTETLAYWQARCLSGQVDIVNLTRRLLESDLARAKQLKTITNQAERIVHLVREARTRQTENPWLAVVRKHLNATTPADLDDELEALTMWYGDKVDELAVLTRQVETQAAVLSEYQNKDNTPLS